jgi:hypothetical protein
MQDEQKARRQGIGTALLLLARTEPAKAYFLLKRLGLCIADLQEAGFTETDIEPLKRGWREVQKRIEATSFREPGIAAAYLGDHNTLTLHPLPCRAHSGYRSAHEQRAANEISHLPLLREPRAANRPG